MEQIEERAHLELVDDIMRGEEFPRSPSLYQTDLMEVLMKVDHEQLASVIYDAMTEGPEDLSLNVAKLVNAYFEGEGNHYVLAKAEELRREDEREREDARTEARILDRAQAR
jgi:hypothetical protein